MISFANIWAPLIGCSAAFVMIILWLLHRLLIPRHVFPPLIWIIKARQKTSRFNPLNPHLHLVFAILSALLLGCFFGRPSTGKSTEPFQTVIIIIDASLSMSSQSQPDEDLFSRAVNKAGSIIRQLNENNRANLAVCGDTIVWAFKNAGAGLGRKRLWRLLEDSKPGYSTGDLSKAVAEGIEKLNQTTAQDKLLYVISDFQRSSWQGLNPPVQAGFRIIPVDVGKPCKDNIYIGPVSKAVFFGFSHEPTAVNLKLINYSNHFQKIRINWNVNSSKIDNESYGISPHSKAIITHHFSFPDPGEYECSAKIIAQDTLKKDNLTYFTISIKERCTVALSSPDQRIKGLLINALGGNTPGPVRALPEENISLTKCGVLLSTGQNTSLIKKASGMGLPVILFTNSPTTVLKDTGLQTAFERGNFFFSNRLSESLQHGVPALESVRVKTRLSTSAGGISICHFSDNSSAVLFFPEKRLILCLFALTLNESGLLRNEQAAVVLLGELVRLAYSTRHASLTAGEKKEILLPRRTYRFFAPSGEEIFPASNSVDTLARIDLPSCKLPGFLRIWQKGRIFISLPVNTPPGESSSERNSIVLNNLEKQSEQSYPSNKKDFSGVILFFLLVTATGWLFFSIGGNNHGSIGGNNHGSIGGNHHGSL